MDETRTRLEESTLFGVLSLVVIAVATHVTLADFDFVSQDRAALIYDGFGSRLSDVGALITGDALAGRVPDAWHPLTLLARTIDRVLFGLWPTGHHLHNVAWHAVAALLIAAWVRQLFANDRLAWLVAAIFACWPAHAAAVAVIDHRDVLIATTAVATALLLLLREVRWGAALVVGLGLLAHELALLALLFWPVVRWMREPNLLAQWRATGKELLWLAGGAVGSLLIRAWWLPHLRLPEILERGGFFAVAGGCVRAFLLQLTHLVAPIALSEIHPDPPPSWPIHLEWLGAAAVVAGLVLLTRRVRDRALVGGAWLTVLGSLPVFLPWLLPQLWSDHLLYPPAMGVALIAARAIDRFLWPTRLRWPILALAAAGIVLIHHQVEGFYQDDATVWARAETVAPQDVRTARGTIALALGAGNLDSAEAKLTPALAIHRSDPVLIADAAVIACLRDDIHAAQEWFKAVPRARHPKPARLLLQEAGCALRHQRYDRAVDAAGAAHELAPWMPDPLAVRGRAHEGLGHEAAAERDLLAASRLGPRRRDIWFGLAAFYEARGFHEKAAEIRRYGEALVPTP